MNETEIRAEHMNIPAKAEGSGFMGYANQIEHGPFSHVGMGSTWEEVRSLNMAGHYYTVQ